MKIIKRTAVIFTVFMLLVLAVFIVIYINSRLSVPVEGSYTDEQLMAYKEITGHVKEAFNAEKDRFFVGLLSFWGIMLLTGYAFLYLVYRYQIRPVKQMEEYAAEIAKGNLDVSLPMERHNMFGSFPESFDMMRGELKEARKREVEAQKAREQMVAELSHDLKTPVATIAATCEVLEMKYRKKLQNGSEEEKKEAGDTLEKIGYISDRSDVINNITDNLFKATIDGSDEIKVDPEETDSKVIEGFFGNYSEYADIVMEDHIPECLVLMDRLRMEQVIDNIIENSLKYAGTPIHVSFKRTEKDADNNSFIKITIRDEGKGVDKEDLPLITEKFKRGKNSSDKSGYGLGLWLVKQYMQRQSGGMEYYNDNGFVVELLVRKV